MDAGLGGEVTDETRRLAAVDPDATRALGDVTAATQALRTRSAPVAPQTGRTARSREPDPKAQRKAKRARRLGTILASLAVLMAIAAVILALTASDGGRRHRPDRRRLRRSAGRRPEAVPPGQHAR